MQTQLWFTAIYLVRSIILACILLCWVRDALGVSSLLPCRFQILLAVDFPKISCLSCSSFVIDLLTFLLFLSYLHVVVHLLWIRFLAVLTWLLQVLGIGVSILTVVIFITDCGAMWQLIEWNGVSWWRLKIFGRHTCTDVLSFESYLVLIDSLRPLLVEGKPACCST